MAPRIAFAAVCCLTLVLGGCADVRTGDHEWAGEFILHDYLPGSDELPEGIVLADHQIERFGQAPVSYPPASVERLSSQVGWGIFTRVAERPFVGTSASVADRSIEEPRIVAFVYLRREGGRWGELEMAAWNRHGTAKRLAVVGGARVVVVLVEDGRDDQIVMSGFGRLHGWFQDRIHGARY